MNAWKSLSPNSRLLWMIMSVNTLVWLIGAFGAIFASTSGMVNAPALSLGVPSDFYLTFTRPWTLLTYMWVQTSFVHLAVNMLCLFWIWRLFSDSRVISLLATYIGGGIFGAISFCICSIFIDHPWAPLIGASSCVLSMMGASVVAFPNLRVRFLFSDNVRLIWISLAFIVLSLIGSGSMLQLAAHAGGVVFGMGFYAILMLKNSVPENINNRVDNTRKLRTDAFKKVKLPPREVENVPVDTLSDRERLDRLLERISLSGYTSLSSSEREELSRISARIDT
ncbi:MAG: rhomboid family intramembrane serine protease [Clostridium sp.]|nr:rhomboid family intramembrane serine protease [Prevotella sp.]MCM1429552.1 rhomboid family intramembrane serine protease [Clostridium sp.]MCM1476040.1 rhomboid family intramembrane serine protease [Muribaculaceae bacterium]